jgi:uncharacterized protein (TIGR04222 family)
MNPFDLRGPEFLGFYVMLMVGTWIVMGLVRRIIDHTSDVVPTQLNDAYAIAFLRGGPKEMARVTILSLIDRGLLKVTDEGVRTADTASKMRVRRETEQVLLDHCRSPRVLATLSELPALKSACRSTEADLQRAGFLPTGAQRAARTFLFLLLGVGVLGGVAATKIAVALSRGRTNIAFLVILGIVALIVAAKVAFPRLTARGKKQLGELRNLFNSLKLRAAELKPGGSTSELALLAAVFGATAVSASVFPWVGDVYPRPVASSSSGYGGDSSSSSSCGSSCGGGCGGGCGGCGS